MSHIVSPMSLDEVGNTKTSSRISSSYYWVFTLNNFTDEEFIILKHEIKSKCADYRVQEEIGENGTKHLQGFIKATKRIRPLETFSLKRIHWEKAKSPKYAREYCCKEDTATGNYILDTKEQLNLIKPDRPWQLEILNIINDTYINDRIIHWYWEPIGNTGKSCFTKYLCAKHNAISVSGKSNDCKYAIVKYHEEKNKYPKIIIFDIPRTSIDYLNYEAIESIKNGCFFSGKYESGQVIMNSPHVFIFANSAPEIHKLSQDRWNIVKMYSEEEHQRTLHNTLSELTNEQL